MSLVLTGNYEISFGIAVNSVQQLKEQISCNRNIAVDISLFPLFLQRKKVVNFLRGKKDDVTHTSSCKIALSVNSGVRVLPAQLSTFNSIYRHVYGTHTHKYSTTFTRIIKLKKNCKCLSTTGSCVSTFMAKTSTSMPLNLPKYPTASFHSLIWRSPAK